MFRLSTRADPAFLAEMLYEVVYWHDDGSEERPSLEALLAQPEHARFVDAWGRAGDVAVLALDRRDEPVGAAWYRRFEAPEMRIAVYPEFRRQGVGSLLLGSLVARARAAGETRLLTTVARENPARRFMVRRGFDDDPERPGTIMHILAG